MNRIRAVAQPAAERTVDAALRTPVVCITLPDSVAMAHWIAYCLYVDQAAEQAYSGRLATPGGWVRTEFTYPGLLRVQDVAWVYVAWKGHVWMRQQASAVRLPTLAEVARMDPLLGNQMFVGLPYQWVFATPELCPKWREPAGAGPRYGRIASLADGGEPVWQTRVA